MKKLNNNLHNYLI